jgi:hypothetical protein
MTEVPSGSKGIGFTTWLVNKAAGVLERKSSRRGFILGSAMVGSAVAVAGCAPGTQPGSPYSHITDCSGGLCTDGYTEFCCTINNGINACPSGSFIGGWWRADYSSFCNGTRYYMDCMQNCCGPDQGNGFCAGCTECTCGGGCDTRRIYCNYFRYGQCHQEIGITGPIACRVVTCTPPYTVADYACSTATAVDNSTAEHAPAHGCTPPPPPRVYASVLPSTGAVVAPTSGTLAAFGRLGDSSLRLNEFDGSSWTQSSLPLAYATSGIEATMAGTDMYLVLRGNDAGYWWSHRPNGGSWAPFQSLGGTWVSDPAIAADSSGVYVFGRGLDDVLWYSRNTGGGFSAPAQYGAGITLNSDPIAVSDATGVYVFVRGLDGGIWYGSFAGGAKQAWQYLGGLATSDPAACGTSSGPVVAVRGGGDTVYVRNFQGASPGPDWQAVGNGNLVTSDPALCSGPLGTYLFVRRSGNGIWTSRYDGSSWPALTGLGGSAQATPIAAADASGVSVLYEGNDTGIWTRRLTGGSWSGEVSIGGTYTPVRAT